MITIMINDHNDHQDHNRDQVCEMIEGLVPDSVHPLCDSVVAHVMITAIYGMITKITTALQVFLSPLTIVDIVENKHHVKTINHCIGWRI